ncbi:MAG: NUDIX hydrolase [Patescibacteria group bacterium]|jgi:8-oxo-dGTP pyrophosphatase MutT (NUDIX family)
MKSSHKHTHATYNVGLKILLRRGNSYLFVYTPEGYLDIPGGRIDATEHTTPLLTVLKRELKEELGTKVRYTIGQPIFHFRRHFSNPEKHIFLVVYEATYRKGDIVLSSEHARYQWLNPKKDVLPSSALFHKEGAAALKNYFKLLPRKTKPSK